MVTGLITRSMVDGMRVDAQPAFVLHSRPYRDSSLIVEFITAEYGRISAVVKGLRGGGKSARQKRGAIQLFVPLIIGWSGNTDLKTVNGYEVAGAPLHLQGERLFSAIYINELLMRLLQPYDRHPEWFVLYRQVLHGLTSAEVADVVLRRFELDLLRELGYGIELVAEVASGEAIVAGRTYRYEVGGGFTQHAPVADQNTPGLFVGKDLLAIAAGDFSDSARRAAKRLCRLALAVHLGDKPLKSRELFG